MSALLGLEFSELTPDIILASAEELGIRCTGTIQVCASYENRVYEIEFEDPWVDLVSSRRLGFDASQWPKERTDSTKGIIKFYRPGRWSREEIVEEHEALFRLHDLEVPVAPPLLLASGLSVGTKVMDHAEIFFSVFPKIRGRSLDELDEASLSRLGRLLGRVHLGLKSFPGKHRKVPTKSGTYSEQLAHFKSWENSGAAFQMWRDTFAEACGRLETYKPRAEQWIHGDFHAGNFVWNALGPNFIDFDDLCFGSPIQDFWLLLSPWGGIGSGEPMPDDWKSFIHGYETFAEFEDEATRELSILRLSRCVSTTTWIARRKNDPAFQRAYANFGTDAYWRSEREDLLRLMSTG